MNIIASFDQHDLGLYDERDQPISYHRQAARAVLTNADSRVAVMYFTTTGSSKLPGGGIDDGESAEEALRREVREETGYLIEGIVELGLIKEYRYIRGMEQTSYCYKARVTEYIGTALTPEEAAEGMELRWYDSLDAAIEAVASSHTVEEGRSSIELEMMIRRDTAILQAAAA